VDINSGKLWIVEKELRQLSKNWKINLLYRNFKVCKKYYKKTLQGVTELTEIHGETFGDII
jgi:hypothetical protein